LGRERLQIARWRKWHGDDGQPRAGLVAIGALVSIYGYLSAKMLGMPRLTFALAKGGDLPAYLAR